MAEVEIESREKVKRLLRELFQFDTQDLDFGIYRIMNFKRKEIEKFIEDDLIKAAEEEFKEYARVGMADLQKEIEKLRTEIIRDFGEGTIDNLGQVKKHEGAPKIRDYQSKMKELESAEVTQAQIEDVFNHIYEFFSRYYDKGDFLSKRRYGGREKYCLPYNGEEVLLNWVTRDQYYVKTGEHFKKYSFRAGAYRVSFILEKAEIEPNSVKVGDRYFVLGKPGISLDEKKRQLDVYFNYRGLTAEERKKYGPRNIQENASSHVVKTLLQEIGNKGPQKELKKKPDDEITHLEKHIKKYVSRNTADYFVHKDLKRFLKRELDFYLKNEVFDIVEIENMGERNIRLHKAKIRAIRKISRIVIDFLAQIESFQKKLFEKKKFVLSADYCMTLDYVPEEFYKEIGENEKQVTEWKSLFRLDDATEGKIYSTKGKKTLDADFLKLHKFLVLDTKFFDVEFKYRLLETFDDLDEHVGGLVVKSENFQALNLLLPKYERRVKSIYIDPPYNTGSDEFLYKDSYRHSTWLSMMANRLDLGRKFLGKDGVIFVSVDDNELHELRSLMNSIYGDTAFITTFVWNTEGHTDNQFMVKVNHEYILSYGRDPQGVLLGHVIDPNIPKSSNLWKGFAENSITKNGPANPPSEVTLPEGFPCKAEVLDLEPTDVPSDFFEEVKRLGYISRELTKKYNVSYPIRKDRMLVKGGRLLQPCRVFTGWANLNKLKRFIDNKSAPIEEEDGKMRFYLSENGVIYYRKDRNAARSILSVFRRMGTTERMSSELEHMGLNYQYPKPEELIRHIVKIGTDKTGTVLDFFAGSGTTAHACLNINIDGGSCRYVLVEMAPYFETSLKPRIQKLMYSRQWKDGLPISNEGISHMFKYIYLEQYEDSLNNIVFRALDRTIQKKLNDLKDFFVNYMLDYETQDSPARLILERFQTPFNYEIRISNGEKEEFVPVDLVETFNYLLGLDVERLKAFKDGERTYRVVFGKRNNKNIAVIWRNMKDLDLEKDKKFIEEKVLSGNAFDLIFINGDSYIKDASAIEPEFKKLMGA